MQPITTSKARRYIARLRKRLKELEARGKVDKQVRARGAFRASITQEEREALK